MKKQLALILFFITSLCVNGFAQAPKSFPEDDAGFVNTLSTYISSNNRPEAKEIGTWLKTNLAVKTTPEDLAVIKGVSGVMLQKKVPLWPAFYNYTNYLKTIANKTDLSASIVTQNHKILLQLLQSNSPEAVRQFNSYVDYLTTHYETKAIYSDKVKSWFASEEYKIEIENQFPVYVFDKITLTGNTSTDTLEILETNGKFYPFTNQWVSKSGKITWKRAGFNPDEVFATFKKYEMDLSKPEINLDTATITFKPYVQNTIQGKFADKLFTSKAVAAAFPQFTSFERVPLKVANEISLESGIGLDGNKLFATSTGRAEPAKLTIYNSKKVKIIEAEAKRYLINNFRQIDGEGAKVQFYFIDSTTIFHPSITLSYNIEKKNLKITRENKNDAKIPFVAPYFKMNLYVDQFDWSTDSSYIDMNSTAVNAKLPTVFESFEYYIEGADSKYQQLLNIDPIGSLASYCESMGYSRLSIDEIARVWNSSGYKAIEQLIFKMMEDGYMYYDRETGMVDVYNKLFLHAQIRKDPENVNYDNIRLSSITQGKVGRLLVDQKKLQIFGTEKTRITSSVNITMNPSSDTVYISENRGIVFKGRLSAGKFNFYSDSIQFNYDEYIFDLKEIDSMLIMVPSGQADSKGNQYFTEINTPIEKISGKIYISDPKQRNKSTKYTVFPYFDCSDTSIVAFDKTSYGEKYSPQKFNFKIYPFKVEKMNTIETDSLKFKGLLVSDGIFNNIETEISITPERTLGLDIHTGEKGLPIYADKGSFFGGLTLNNEGLNANGKIEKGNMTLYGEKILLLPDSAGAALSKWEAVENAKMDYPVLTGPESKMSWITSVDSMSIQPVNKGEVLAYNQLASLTGDFTVRKNILSSSGSIKIDETVLNSDSIILAPQSTTVYKTPLAITKNADKVFTAGVAEVNVDFKAQTAKITIPEDSIAKFNYNYLNTNYNDYVWDIKNSTITVNGNNPQKSRYYEFVENKLKGIKLSADNTVFDEATRELNLSGVSQMLVADSKVIPFEEKLKITNGGLIDILENATVYFNTDSSFHKITSAQVEILNKDLMKGAGVLPVKTGNTTKDVKVESFKTIEETSGTGKKAKQTYYTVAEGVIEDTDEFKLSANLKYKGKLLFNSLDRAIQLEGYAQSQFKSIPESEWFKISQSLDLNKSSLKIDSLKNELGQDIYTGLMLDLNEFSIYPRVIQSKETSTDKPIYTATGFLKSNPNDPVILFGQEDALSKPGPFKSLMKFNDSTGSVDVTGNFPLVDLKPNTFSLWGSASYQKGTPLAIKGSLSMNLQYMSDIQNLIIRFLSDFNTSAISVSLARNKQHSYAVTRNLTDAQTISLVTQDMEESGILNLPPNYPYNTIFSDVTFTYDSEESSFKSIAPLNMLVFAGRPFAQKITGYMEAGPRGTSDFFNLYLTTASNDWLFIRYMNGEMAIISSDPQLNNSIAGMKEEKRSIKSGKEVVYKITLTNPALKDNFVSRMEDYKDRIVKP